MIKMSFRFFGLKTYLSCSSNPFLVSLNTDDVFAIIVGDVDDDSRIFFNAVD